MHGKSSKGFDVCVPDIMEYIIYHDSGTSRESDGDGDSYRSWGFVDGCFRFVPVMKSVNILVHRLDVDKPVGKVEMQLPVDEQDVNTILSVDVQTVPVERNPKGSK